MINIFPSSSTVPFDMKPIPRAAHEPVLTNETKVKMKPRPWTQKWERTDFKVRRKVFEDG